MLQSVLLLFCTMINKCTIISRIVVFLLLFCAMTNKCTIMLQTITLLLHVSTLLFHLQGAYNQYLANLRKYFKCSCW